MSNSIFSIIVVITLFLIEKGMADFGGNPRPDMNLSIEDRGVPNNCAFLAHYADAVVLAKKEDYANAGNVLNVVEVLWKRGDLKVDKKIYMVATSKHLLNITYIDLAHP